MQRATASVYVDGFNLYRRALANGPHKWLDLQALAENLLHDHDIALIRYFTAHLKPQRHDPQAPQRQQIYLRALRTNPRIHVHLGHFRSDPRDMPLHPLRYDDEGKPVTIRVRKTEEKGSDVNLATHLLLDAFRGLADTYVVVSNDSDLAEPMRVVRDELGFTMGLVTPAGQPSKALLATNPQLIRQVREGVLAASQFPAVLSDGNGSFRRPSGWGQSRGPGD